MILVSRDFKKRMEDAASRMTYVDLGGEPGYMDQYTASLFIPHTDSSHFPSVALRLAEGPRKQRRE
jgi:uncharacterized 2Fe-2S/4Fe-4S cluster protein (DUF4445 family)